MKLVIHVGFHKTGTSAIQTFCRENRGQLAKKGILYPKSGVPELKNPSTPSSEAGHRLLQDVLVSPTNKRSGKLIKSIINEANSYEKIDTVVISSETFSAPRVKISTAASSLLKKYFTDIKILVYLRRQDDWAESFYKEVLCWSGKREKRSFERFRNEFLPDWLDYNTRLEKYAAIFDEENLIVNSYDDRTNKNIIQDFFSVLGLSVLEQDEYQFPGYSNPSLPGALIPLMLEINNKQLSREHRSLLTNRIFGELAASDYKVCREPICSSLVGNSFITDYRDKNLDLCRKYQIKNCDYLSYSLNRAKAEDETSLSREQIDEKKLLVEGFIREYSEELTLERSRVDKGRVGISCLLNESPEQVKVFVYYHLALGVSKIRLYFDDPDDQMADFDYGSKSIEIIRCTKEFWQHQIGREPDNNGEKLSACHMDGLNYLNQLDDVDWSINLDADELLYINRKVSLSKCLSSISPRLDQIKVRPLEAIFVDEKDSNLFSARYFKVPRVNFSGGGKAQKKGLMMDAYYFLQDILRTISSYRLARWLFLRKSVLGGADLAWSEKDEALYRKYMPVLSRVMREGFLAHREGRVLTRHGIKLDQVTSHTPKCSTRKLATRRRNKSIFVLHYDAADFSAWHLKWHRRIYGDTTASAIHDKRRIQQDLFREATENGDASVRQLFNDFFMFPEATISKFEQAGLVVKLDIPLLEQVKK